MAVVNGDASEKSNGDLLLPEPATAQPSVDDDEKDHDSTSRLKSSEDGVTRSESKEDATFYGLFNNLIESILDPHPNSNQGSTTAPPSPPTVNRIKKSLLETAPLFREAIEHTRREVLQWTRRGSPLRALLVVSVGIVGLLGLTGMLMFMLFFVAATVNAIVISFLISVAAAGTFFAIFFSCVTAIYIVALCIAASVTFIVTISSIVAAFVAAGWIGFVWIMWVAATKSVAFAKRSLSISGHQTFPATGFGQQNAWDFKKP